MNINICGFTAAQNNTKLSNKKDVRCLSNILPTILMEMGHGVTLGDYSGKADLNFVFIYTLNSLNTSYATKSLELLKNNDNCIICFDDWNIKLVYRDNENIIEGRKIFKSHPHYNQEQIQKYISVLEKINSGGYRVLFPAFSNGDHELLEIRGDKTFIDPSIYCEYNIDIDLFGIPEKKWIYAGLCKKDSWIKKIKTNWPIEIVKNVTENEVLEIYQSVYSILCPPHYHMKSGWWRNRYVMANKAKCILIGDPEENKLLFGDSYGLNVQDVETLNRSECVDLIDNQNIDYQGSIMSKQEIKNIINRLIQRYE